jgi:hypothetical protein
MTRHPNPATTGITVITLPAEIDIANADHICDQLTARDLWVMRQDGTVQHSLALPDTDHHMQHEATTM